MSCLLVEKTDGALHDVPDPATGLTPRQKRYVTESWAIVRKDLKTHGRGVLLAFFTSNPVYIKNFKAFQNMELSELPGNKKFLAHANAVIYALTSIVDNLDETEVLVEMLRKLGKNHGQRNIEKIQFNRLRFALMEYLKENLGREVMTPEAEEAWNEVLDVAFSIIFEGVELGMKNAIY
ncbi:globin [Anabrus simplex]|uniref:globin n=1 Tax=Anabrus simplex TaxID=316456 RepID=UPI0035A374E8